MTQSQNIPDLTTIPPLVDAGTTTVSHDTTLSTHASLGIAIITGIPVLVNIVYVIVCFKTLRKKFHNLLVLTLCICDCFLGVSLTWYIIASLLDSMRDNVESCLFQTFAVGYGLVSSYSIILLICLERYAVVRARNFGISETLDRFKYLAIGGTLALGFLFTIETVLFIHAEDTIVTCSVPNLYGDRFSFFVQVMIGGVSTILILIVIVTIRTSYMIWDLFYENNKVHYSDIELSTHYNSQRKGTFEPGSLDTSITINSNTTSCHQTQVQDTQAATSPQTPNTSTLRQTHDIDTSSTISTEPSNSSPCCKIQERNTVEGKIQFSLPESSLGICMADDSANTHSETGLPESPIMQVEQEKRKTSNIKVQLLITQMKMERLNDGKRDIAKMNRKQINQSKSFKFGAWEFRAFATSIIIALTTIIFTGPFIISFWIDVFTGTLLPQQNRFWLFVPLVMNSIVNPFIYAWRIPEIRKELKRVFCC